MQNGEYDSVHKVAVQIGLWLVVAACLLGLLAVYVFRDGNPYGT